MAPRWAGLREGPRVPLTHPRPQPLPLDADDSPRGTAFPLFQCSRGGYRSVLKLLHSKVPVLIPGGFPLDVVSAEPPLLPVNSVVRIRPDLSPDVVGVLEPLSRGAPCHVHSSRTGLG